MIGLLRWGCTLVSAMLVIVWAISLFVDTHWVLCDFGYFFGKGAFGVERDVLEGDVWWIQHIGSGAAYELMLEWQPVSPFLVKFSIWLAAMPFALIAAWAWEARWRGRIGVVRWLLTFVAFTGVFVWITSRWTMYGYGAESSRVIVVNQRVLFEQGNDFGSVFYHTTVLKALTGARAGHEVDRVDEPGLAFVSHRAMNKLVRQVRRPTPVWSFPLLVVAAPLVLFAALAWWRAPPRVRPGCCRKCGYDLRGSGAVCPECGTRRDPAASSAESAS